MSSIRIVTGTGTWDADRPRSFVIGRDRGCDIVTDVPHVSRRHAEIRPAGDGWEVVDLGSSGGTWIGGQPTPTAPLTGTTEIALGGEEHGLRLTVTVTPPAPPVPASVPAPPTGYAAGGPGLPPPPSDVTIVPQAGMPGPGGFGGPGILVRHRAADLSFAPYQPVRIGRDDGLEVVARNPSVSRQHAVLEPRPDGWWLVDRSTAGTFVDGQRVGQRRLTEPTTVLLGHPTAGYEVELVPLVEAGVASRGIARRKRRRSLTLVGGALALLVVLTGGVIGAVALLGGDDEPAGQASRQSQEGGAGLSEAELDRAKAATVYLVAIDPSGQPLFSGSGSIISADGRILTNAHVADSDAPGQGGEALDHVEVYFTSPADDEPVTLRYLARASVSDGYLDVAVAQIYADGEGDPVDVADLDLPEPLPLGDSDDLRTLDEITALGYPGLSTANSDAGADLPTLTVTEGTVSTFSPSAVIGVDRAEIDADLRIGSGNSGGPSINEDGEIIGLNTRVFTESLETQLEEQGQGEGGIFTGGSARIVPVNLAGAVLDIAEQGGDPAYVSPYLDELPDPDEQVQQSTIEAHGWSLAGAEGTCAATSTADQPQVEAVAPGETVSAEFVISGLADGTNLSIELYTLPGGGGDAELFQSVPIVWEAENDGACIWIGVEAPSGVRGLNAVPQVGDQLLVDNPLLFQ